MKFRGEIMINLKKNASISFAKEAPNLSKILIGLGWENKPNFDLDASAFILSTNGKVRSDEDFIFYNQKQSTCGAVKHAGDARNGAQEDDDEIIHIDLKKLSQDVKSVVFTVSLHEYEERCQNFGMLKQAYIRLVDEMTGRQIAIFDLDEDAGGATSMIFGQMNRSGNDWNFVAVGQGFNFGIAEMAQNFGVNC